MKKFALPLVILIVAGCAVRLGGSRPVEYETVAIQFDAGTSVTDAAARLRELNADVALIATREDTTWVRQLAQQMQLVSTRPGRAGDYTLAFLATKPVGDTTLTLNVEGGGSIRMHDALYNIDKVRKLDLMTVILQPGTSTRNGVRTLLSYIATDVSGDAAVALAIQAPSAAAGDSIRGTDARCHRRCLGVYVRIQEQRQRACHGHAAFLFPGCAHALLGCACAGNCQPAHGSPPHRALKPFAHNGL